LFATIIGQVDDNTRGRMATTHANRDARAAPRIVKGKWIAPAVTPGWSGDTVTPSPIFGNGDIGDGMRGHQLPGQISAEQYPLGEYWQNVQAELEASAQTGAMDIGRDGDDDEPMLDAMGVPLPQMPKPAAEPKGVKRQVWEVFLEQCAKIEKGFVPLGMINPGGNLFKFVMPPGYWGEQFTKRITHILPLVISAASRRFYKMCEQYIIVMNVLPCPIHVSPLALALIREPEHCNRYTDAISLLLRLHILRHCLHDLDTENPVHKDLCWRLYKRVEARISTRYYQEIARLYALEHQQQQPSRAVSEQTAHGYGAAATQYAIDMVHAIEFCCLSILRIPYEWRYLFMTPNDTPLGSDLPPASFDHMYKHLCNYVTNRNLLYCANVVEEIDPVTKAKKSVFKVILFVFFFMQSADLTCNPPSKYHRALTPRHGIPCNSKHRLWQNALGCLPCGNQTWISSWRSAASLVSFAGGSICIRFENTRTSLHPILAPTRTPTLSRTDAIAP